MIMKINEGLDTEEWAMVCSSIGDCKIFIYDSKAKITSEITIGNRGNLHDASDCGGRLGPYIDGKSPDLGNLGCYFWPCKKSDILLILSDGVHDNFDPKTLGYLPSDVTDTDCTDWKKLDYKTALRLKTDFSTRSITNFLEKVPSLTPKHITTSLLEYSKDITKLSRKFLEENPDKPEPRDYKNYPGKMDHCTVVTVLLGNMFENTGGTHVLAKTNQNTRINHKTTSKQKKEIFLNPFSTIEKDVLLNKDLLKKRVERFSKQMHKFITGPDSKEEQEKVGSIASAWACSTFPKNSNDKKRLGDPITETYSLELNLNRFVAVLTGSPCKGESARQSSQCANLAFQDYLRLYQSDITECQKAALHCVRASEIAHNTIMVGPPAPKFPYIPQPTYLLGGILMEEEDFSKTISQSYWTFVFINIGKFKAYLWKNLDSKVVDMTGTRMDQTIGNAKIGPANDSLPNLNGAQYYHQMCSQNDIIMIVSPAVYKNFEPKIMGKKPSEVGQNKPNWKFKLDEDQLSIWRCQRIEALLKEKKVQSPSDVTEAMMKHCIDLTKKTRDYLEVNSTQKLPKDFEKYPGKLGHCAILAFRVTRFKTNEAVRTGHANLIATTYRKMPLNPNSHTY
eukprot:TRINITY_DN2050_c0_g2_i3.p1 TRINITY_DN2050_c0_g2~~TRINITY_DN2050_c0_g2_i3.p1  ORF type:complete len:621 (-),score=90.69 TRINITY_DN2050_c0_g2_i3:79-1941(-)